MEQQNLYIFNFSKFIFKILISFLIICLIFNYSFEEHVIFKSEISGAFKVNKIINETKATEIPIFGSSRSLRSFVPSLLGENYFNYGIAGTQSNIWLFFLENELSKEKSTPIIINYDLNGLTYSDGDIANYIPNWNKTKGVLKSKGEIYYHVPFVKYFGKFELYSKYLLNNRMNLTKVTDNGGSFEKNVLTSKKFNELVKKRENTKAKFQINNNLNKKLNHLIKSTNREIIFVISPYHESYFKNYQNLNEAEAYLNELNDFKNVRVIDLRNFITDNSMFKNTTHLNYLGAVKFSEHIKNILPQN
ncbi:hypothetical protein [Winogradskyella endarachnes]|uniref:DUF1574 domain-containing protein n=1 Tax=Winogradskyella endarachnes TaxID=2681965 RepID=A0A6L6U8P9_9FLAO|nr:hypothetical protein [Winogradskyella endarachnes]MUU77886.1 hypothetical protein [Winogradskyella endarachnes]